MATTEKSTKVLRLCSSDGETFEVSEEAIREASGTIKAILEEKEKEEEDTSAVIPLPNVTAAVLARVLEYVEKHFADPTNPFDACFHAPDADDPLKRFDEAFVDVDHDTLFDLITAANYLEIESLLDLTCKLVADQMKGKTTDEIREHFHVFNDYTKEEEDEVHRENSWAFE